MESRILIAGIGNIFMGDDAFGSEVARRLQEQELGDGVRVVDFGIRGFDLAYALLDGREEVTILVDATPRGGTPGTLYTIEPDLSALDELDAPGMIDTHDMNPLTVLAMVKSMGGNFRRLLLVGCEPVPLEAETDGRMCLSEPVQAAVNEAVKLIGTIVARILSEPRVHAASV